MKQLISSVLLISVLTTHALISFAGIPGDMGKTKTINVDDAKLVYRIHGDKGGTPLVLLAPLGASLDDWDPALIEGLAKYSTVVVFDNKGVGASTGKTPNTIAAMAQDAISFIKTLGYSKVNLLGYSMGGFIAQQIVETEPQLVGKLILIGTGPQGAEGLSEVGQKIQSIASLSPEEQFLQANFTSSANSRQSGKEAFARIHSKKEGRDLPLSQESFVAALTAVLGWAQPDPNALQRAKGVSNQVLIIGAQDDLLIAVANPLNLYRSMPHARLLLLPDAGHGALFQYPALVSQEAGYFLKN